MQGILTRRSFMRCKCRVHREPCKNKECCYNETAFDTLDEEFYTAVANLDKIDKNFLKDMDITWHNIITNHQFLMQKTHKNKQTEYT